MRKNYKGWFGRTARRRCPHSELGAIYGDQINFVGGWRLQCLNCRSYLDGPVKLAEMRRQEWEPVDE